MSLELGDFVGQTPMPETIGDVWTIQDIQQSGLLVNQRIRNANALQYYVRESSLNMWKFLNESLNNPVEVPVLSITGDPGCGKSTLLYGWVRHRSTSAKVLWTSVNQLNNQIYIRVFDPTGVLHMEEIEYDTLDQGQFALKKRILLILTVRTDVRHVVLDGITSYSIVSPIALKLNKRTQSLVVCSSMQAALVGLPAQASDYCTLFLFTIEAWTLHELLAAQRVSKELNTAIFDTNITNSAEAFYERFRVAGCNMRYMASTDGNTETIGILYKSALQRMSGQELLNWSQLSKTGNEHCDILYQHRYVNGALVTSFASRYVEDSAVVRLDSSAHSLAALLDPYNNNIMYGWQYATRMRLAVKMLARGDGGAIMLRKHRDGLRYNQTLTMPVRRFIDYDALPAPLDLNTVNNGWSAVYLPSPYCQSCFDAVYVALEKNIYKVYFLRLTMDPTHEVNLQYAGAFLEALLPSFTSTPQSCIRETVPIVPMMPRVTFLENWSVSVHYYFVLPKANVGVFNVGTVENVESISQFDRAFSESKIRTVYVESVADHKNVTQSVS